MKNIHLVIADLFLPEDMATQACAGLYLPVLEKMLARGAVSGMEGLRERTALTLENHLSDFFGVSCGPVAPVAPISAAFDGLGEGCWLRADPVHLRLQRDQLVLLSAKADTEEAHQLCAALNEYFVGQGMEFFAPHPDRWYMRLDTLPDIETVHLSQAEGRNVRDLLPRGKDAARWHRVFNEIQMLLFAHPVNEAREARGELPVNSLWLWGGGTNVLPQKNCVHVRSDEVLAEMFALASRNTFSGWAARWSDFYTSEGNELLVWTGLRQALKKGDMDAWRIALQEFETAYAVPLWHALRTGKISQLQVDILGGYRVLRLNRADTFAFWRRSKTLADYSSIRE